MPAYNVEIHSSNATDFANIVYPRTLPENVVGLLTDGKITGSLLPSFIVGGMRRVGIITAATDTNALQALIVAALATGESPENKYFIVGASSGTSVVITIKAGHRVEQAEELGGYLEGSDTGSVTITVENGDWFIVSRDVYGAGIIYWAVINNTYQDATSAQKGIIQIATDAEVTTGVDTTKAVTPAGAKKAAHDHHPNGATTSGTYTKVTVDAHGHIGAGANPTTLAGYGITDAAPSSHIGATGAAHGVATAGGVNGFMSAADKTKLDGIAASANNYAHPTQFEISIDAAGNETVDVIAVNGFGHVTGMSKQTIRSATEALTGIVQFATAAIAKVGTNTDQAVSPARVKDIIDVFATIAMGTVLPPMTTEAERALQPAGKLFLLQV